ncbi:MAG: tRNA pseudouridine(38-40) synthase TruA, partial [Chloroflexota bacterium]|nr:tRNA pseudouridine(38-40) synthase TruA [Chloroflexota bacterium]
ITGEEIRIRGAGRTDAGVHAKAQVVAFESESELESPTIIKALNFHLPNDIAIKGACEVQKDFDPRRDAISREYRYTILNDSERSPLSRAWACLVPWKLDTEIMNKACGKLLGKHDFAPFTNKEGGTKNTNRTVFKAEVSRKDKFVFFDMIANAFLPQQVRRTVGSLIEVGLGKMGIDEFTEIANSGTIGMAKLVAPPHSLCLMKVNYSEIGFNYENV